MWTGLDPSSMKHLISLTLLALVSGCGSSSGAGSDAPAAPSGLTYGESQISYMIQVEIEANVPTYQGKVTSWSVEPALPAGLNMDPDTGRITGKPLVEQEYGQYIVTATGPSGADQSDLDIEVVHPARFAYAAGSDDSIGVYTVDAFSGALRFHGLHNHSAPDTGPEQVAVHPSGRFVYVPNLGQVQQNSTVTAYSVDPSTGTLITAGHAVIGEGPHRLELHPNGQFVYGISFADHMVHVYTVDQVTGDLTALQTIQTNTGPERLAIDPLGRFLYIAHRPSADIAAFTIQPDGTLTRADGFNYYEFIPSDVGVDHTSSFAYFTFEITDTLVSYRIDQTTGELLDFKETSTTGAPSAVALHPSRLLAYVTSSNTGTIDLFVLDSVDGSATKTETYAAGVAPTEIAFDPSGRQLYVLDEGSDESIAFAVDPKSGELTELSRVRTRAATVHLEVLRGEKPAQPREEFLYVVNSDSDDVAGFGIDVDTGQLTPTGSNVFTGHDPSDVAIDPLGRYAWVANATDNSISVFAIQPETGELLESGQPYSLPGSPGGLVADPAGDYVYVTLSDRDEVLGLLVLANGALTQLDMATTGPGPDSASIDPTGQFVYVSNVGPGPHTLSAYRVHQGQFIAPRGDAPAPGHPGQLRFSPNGAFAYVALRTSELVVPYEIDAQSGALTVMADGSQSVSTNPTEVSLTPDGQFAYVAVPGGANEAGFIASFHVDLETGSLSAPIETHEGLSPHDLRVGPAGRFLYVANEGGDDLSVFEIDGDTGALTVVGVSAVGLAPQALILATKVD
jgi:6-phosphogluconolactonase (cycloisomerase 2 family)